MIRHKKKWGIFYRKIFNTLYLNLYKQCIEWKKQKPDNNISKKNYRHRKKPFFKWARLPFFTSAFFSSLALLLFFGWVIMGKSRVEREAEVYEGTGEVCGEFQGFSAFDHPDPNIDITQHLLRGGKLYKQNTNSKSY